MQNVKQLIETKLTGNHNGLGVAAQAVLEQPGEDGVPVGDVRRAPATAAARGRAVPTAALRLARDAGDALAAAEHLGILCWGTNGTEHGNGIFFSIMATLFS